MTKSQMSKVKGQKLVLNDENEMKRFAVRFAETLRGGDAIALIGDLGAGKTTFVRGLAAAFGVDESEVSSPTFVYMHVHAVKRRMSNAKSPIGFFVHVDAYRGDAATMREIGLEEYLGRPDTVTVIEWGGKVAELLPKDAVILAFTHEGGDKRSVKIQRP